MKIILEFNSIEEMQQSIQKLEQINLEREVGVTAMEEDKKKTKKQLTAKELNATAQKTADIINAAEEKMEAEKAAKKEAKAEEPKEEPKVDYDALRVECRKVMAALNKATGKNTAGEIIKAHGANKLSEVEDMFLPALLEEAKEALADAE